MTINQNMTVGAAAAAQPDTLAVFQKLGIDFCCGGKRPLAEALAEKQVSFEHFLELTESERSSRENRADAGPLVDFNQMSPAVLSAYIEDTHHDYLRMVLPQISELMLAVLRAHGKNHREVFEVYRLYGALRADLEQHLIKEEKLLFPGMANTASQAAEVAGLASDIVGEHEAAGAVLDKLRELTNDFTPPADACLTFRKAYSLMEALEQDLHQHIHLENNILLRGLAK
ncbi:MAG: iron-sulfur cluster repair di-iron protein [Clostridium sp. SCN 57-10]|nr:MAG: iron-sulfur cluster repair di-iron protein [Clostridium sp. SCN 57-10]